MSGETAAALEEFAWPVTRLRDALDSLVIAAQLPAQPLSQPTEQFDEASLTRGIREQCELRGLEAQDVHVLYGDVHSFLYRSTPSVLVPTNWTERIVVLVRARRHRLLLLAPDGSLAWFPIERAARELRDPIMRLRNLTEQLRECFGVDEKRAEQLNGCVRNERARDYRVAVAWLVRVPASAPLLSSARATGARAKLARAALLSIVSTVVSLLAFLVVGEALLNGHLNLSTLIGAGAAMVSAALVGAVATKINGMLQLEFSTVIKGRQFEGALRMPVDALRHGGLGFFLGMITEATAFEDAALLLLSGTFQALALLGLGLMLLALGAAPWAMLGGFLALVVVQGFIASLYYRRQRHSTDLRLASALTVVENLSGQRTRMVQQAAEDWHTEEDTRFAAYNAAIHAQDTAAIGLRVAPMAWLVIAFGVLGAALIAGDTAGIAVSVVAIIATTQGLEVIGTYVESSIRLLVALRAIRAILNYGRAEATTTGAVGLKPDLAPGERIIELRGIRFTYPTTGRVVLDSVTLSVEDGDRVLVTGKSGGGKTTLLHVMSGIRKPDAGMLLFRGADAQALSDEALRRIVATAPQFHENHILCDTLLFNLLLGREWPPTPPSIEEAAQVCEELGLGPLIARMPNGLRQTVGETGWQLSHGERSKVFIARALLQKAPLVIFDESFGALDSESMSRCLDCAFKRSRAILVVAHP